jgi:hypothetical protein
MQALPSSTEARDAAARLALFEPMTNHLIDSGVLAAIAAYIPSVKPLSRLPPSQWGPLALREINNSLFALEQMLFLYTRADREADLPAKALGGSQLTSWICDVLHGEGKVACCR